MAALELLRDEPRRVEKLGRNAAALRAALAAEGLPALPGDSHIVTVHAGPAAGSGALVDRILEKGLFVTVERAGDTAALRLSVMASHTKSELARRRARSRRRCPSSVRKAAARGALEAGRRRTGCRRRRVRRPGRSRLTATGLPYALGSMAAEPDTQVDDDRPELLRKLEERKARHAGRGIVARVGVVVTRRAAGAPGHLHVRPRHPRARASW